jgi:hypothetical protein
MKVSKSLWDNDATQTPLLASLIIISIASCGVFPSCPTSLICAFTSKFLDAASRASIQVIVSVFASFVDALPPASTGFSASF